MSWVEIRLTTEQKAGTMGSQNRTLDKIRLKKQGKRKVGRIWRIESRIETTSGRVMTVG